MNGTEITIFFSSSSSYGLYVLLLQAHTVFGFTQRSW